MKNDTDDNPQKTEDNIKIEKKEDIDDADDSNDTDYKEETEDSEETEETEDSVETEETEDSEETEETKNTEESDCTQEYVINKDINYELNNEEYNNNFNKFQDDDNNQMIYLILNTNKKNDTNNKCVKSKSNNGLNLNKHPINKKIYKFYNKYSINEKKYFDILSEEEKTKLIESEDVIENADIIYDVPMRFKILNSDINIRTKKSIIWKIECLNKMSSNSSEYYKLSSWLSSSDKISKYFFSFILYLL